MERPFRGIYHASASGGKLYSFINALHSAGVCCQKQHCQGERYLFRFEAKHRRQVELLAETYHVTLELQEQPSLRKFLRRVRFRFGIPVGVLFVLTLFFYTSNIVLKIEVIGATSETEQAEILAVLEEEGVTQGSWIPKIDFASCEHRLRAAVSELSWVGMRHTGNRLVVEVTERTPVPEMRETRVPCNLIASQDAQITAVSVYCGQLVRLVGDSVREGELLVSGVVLDDAGHTAIRHAMGSITGIYTEEQVFTCPFTEEIRTVTGNVTSRRDLNLFSWHLPLGEQGNPYTDSFSTTETRLFSFLGAEIPIGIYQEQFHEIRCHTVTYTQEEATQRLEEQETRYVDNFLHEVEILDKKITVLETEDGITWNVTYTLEGEIAVQQELFLQQEGAAQKSTQAASESN